MSWSTTSVKRAVVPTASKSLSYPVSQPNAIRIPNQRSSVFASRFAAVGRFRAKVKFHVNSFLHLISSKKHFYFFEPHNRGVTNPIMQKTIRTSRFYGDTIFVPYHYYIHPSMPDVSIFVIPGYIATLYLYIRHVDYRHPKSLFIQSPQVLSPAEMEKGTMENTKSSHLDDEKLQNEKLKNSFLLSSEAFHSIIANGWQLAPKSSSNRMQTEQCNTVTTDATTKIDDATTDQKDTSSSSSSPCFSHQGILLDGGSAADVHLVSAFVDYLNVSVYAPDPFRYRNRAIYWNEMNSQDKIHRQKLSSDRNNWMPRRLIDPHVCMGQQPQRQLERERLTEYEPNDAISSSQSYPHATNYKMDKGLSLSLVCSTHAHPDHAGGVEVYMQKYKIPCTMTPHARKWYDGSVGGPFQFWMDIVLAIFVGIRGNPRSPLFKSYYRLPKDGAKGLIDVKDGDVLRVGATKGELEATCTKILSRDFIKDKKNFVSLATASDLQRQSPSTSQNGSVWLTQAHQHPETGTIDYILAPCSLLSTAGSKKPQVASAPYSNLPADVTVIGNVLRLSTNAAEKENASTQNASSLSHQHDASLSTYAHSPYDWHVIYCPGHTNHMYVLYLPAGKLLYVSDMMILNTSFIKQQRKKRLKYSNMLLPVKWKDFTTAQSFSDTVSDWKNTAGNVCHSAATTALERKEILLRSLRALQQTSTNESSSARPVSQADHTPILKTPNTTNDYEAKSYGHINIACGNSTGDEAETSSTGDEGLSTYPMTQQQTEDETDDMTELEDTPFYFVPRQQLSNAQLFELQNVSNTMRGEKSTQKVKTNKKGLLFSLRHLNPLKWIAKVLTTTSSHHDLSHASTTSADTNHSATTLAMQEEKEEVAKTKAHVWWWSHLFDKAPFKVVAPVPIECPDAYNQSLDILAKLDVRTLMFPHGEVVPTEYLAGTMTFKQRVGRKLHHRHMYQEDWETIEGPNSQAKETSEEEQERLRAQHMWHGILEECRYKAGDTLFARTWLSGYNSVLKKDKNWVMNEPK